MCPLESVGVLESFVCELVLSQNSTSCLLPNFSVISGIYSRDALSILLSINVFPSHQLPGPLLLILCFRFKTLRGCQNWRTKWSLKHVSHYQCGYQHLCALENLECWETSGVVQMLRCLGLDPQHTDSKFFSYLTLVSQSYHKLLLW